MCDSKTKTHIIVEAIFVLLVINILDFFNIKDMVWVIIITSSIDMVSMNTLLEISAMLDQKKEVIQ